MSFEIFGDYHRTIWKKKSGSDVDSELVDIDFVLNDDNASDLDNNNNNNNSNRNDQVTMMKTLAMTTTTTTATLTATMRTGKT